ncbi:hypothetical protein Poly24_42300 [Rosistilla carotiformis]|uniref:Uncharacterized protein n=1 Tax=Rosistilla carotiformis TaxID=2528017 RepID=A0A518JY89_9BACT|nr:hypothetical protein Poly24_42300 [Rosistilla carotiformis]
MVSGYTSKILCPLNIATLRSVAVHLKSSEYSAAMRSNFAREGTQKVEPKRLRRRTVQLLKPLQMNPNGKEKARTSQIDRAGSN